MLRATISVLLFLGATWSSTEATKATVELMTHHPSSFFRPDDPHDRHWVLIVLFEDDARFYACEYFFENEAALKAENLTSRCDRISGFDLRYTYKINARRYDLGTVDTTPERLLQLVNETRWNGGEYPFCPCQELIAEVIGKLGFDGFKAGLVKYMRRDTDDWPKLGEGAAEAPSESASPKKALVKLLTSNLEGDGEVLSKIGTVITPTGEGGKHWALVLQFDGDNDVHVCELYRNSDAGAPKGSGAIEHRCERTTKQQAVSGKTGINIYVFGNTKTTPERLRQLAAEVSYNGQDYNLFLRNCQHWTKELLFKLKMDAEGVEVGRFLDKTTTGVWLQSRYVGHEL